MNRWKCKENYLKYISTLYKKCKNKSFKMNLQKDSTNAIRQKMLILKNSNPYYYTRCKELFSDSLFEYMASYELDLSIMDIVIIENTSIEIKESREKRCPVSDQKYQKYINNIKDSVNTTSTHSLHEVELVDLPLMESATKNMLLKYFKESKTDKETIDHIFSYLEMRKPRHTNLTNVLIGISDECVKMAKNIVVDGNININDYRNIILESHLQITKNNPQFKLN